MQDGRFVEGEHGRHSPRLSRFIAREKVAVPSFLSTLVQPELSDAVYGLHSKAPEILRNKYMEQYIYSESSPPSSASITSSTVKVDKGTEYKRISGCRQS